ncbi:MAG TPA: TadE family protein [Candidatus Binatia bacterium]|nr:TadE family protein [Candidatus Binatia bacterium]
MLMKAFLSKIRGRQGQSIVEITLMAPLILIALYVPADFGVAFYIAHLTQNAVREAARIGAAQDPFDSAAIQNEALSRLPSSLTSKTATATLHSSGSADCAKFVEVVGGGTYNFFLYQVMRLFGFTVPNTQTIMRTARLRYELQPVTNSTPCT